MEKKAWVASKKAKLADILDNLKGGIVVVEGAHDVEVLARLGISAVGYDRFRQMVNETDPQLGSSKTFYLMMDLDRKDGGDKERKTIEMLAAHYPGARRDTNLGVRFQNLLDITSVEQAYWRVVGIMNRRD